MGRGSNQKLKLLWIKKILEERTDEDHPITTPQLIALLAEEEISAERKSIYDDMDSLCRFGVDVQRRTGKTQGWFIGRRDFELAELKQLADAVQVSPALTGRKSAQLIGKLGRLASAEQAKALRRPVFVGHRINTMDQSSYHLLDRLHAALAQGMGVSFRRFEWSVDGQPVYRRGGARYSVEPYGLLWENESHYLVGFDRVKKEIRHYRVDQMADLALVRLPTGVGREGFDMAAYGGRHFGIFPGRAGQVRLRCRNNMAGAILDRFGQEVMLIPDGEDHFAVTVEVMASPPFFGWLFSLWDGVELKGPEWAVNEYRRRLAGALGD